MKVFIHYHCPAVLRTKTESRSALNLTTKPKGDSLEKMSHPRTLIVRAASLESVIQADQIHVLKLYQERKSEFLRKQVARVVGY